MTSSSPTRQSETEPQKTAVPPLNSNVEARKTEVEVNLKQDYERAMKCIDNQQYEEAISIFEDSLRAAVNAYGEEAFELAEHYYNLGSVLLAKIENSKDVFGGNPASVQQEEDWAHKQQIQTRPAPQHLVIESDDKDIRNTVEIDDETNDRMYLEEDEQEKQVEDAKNHPQSSKSPEETKNSEVQASKEGGEDEPEDIQLAWEHLEIARVFTEKKLAQANSDEDLAMIAKATQFLADIHSKLGDANCYRENFNEALGDYQHCLSLRKFNEDPLFSRDIAGAYYSIGQGHLYMNSKEDDETALTSFHKARIILQNKLNRELNIQEIRDPENIDEHKSPMMRKEFLSPNIFEKSEIRDLKNILLELYNKIEDTTQQKNERDHVQAEIEKVKAQQLKDRQLENSFGKPILGMMQAHDQPPAQSQQPTNSLPSTFNFSLFNAPAPATTTDNSMQSQAQPQDPPKFIKLGVFGNAAKKRQREEAEAAAAAASESATKENHEAAETTPSSKEEKENSNETGKEEEKKTALNGKVTKVDDLGKPEKMVKTN